MKHEKNLSRAVRKGARREDYVHTDLALESSTPAAEQTEERVEWEADLGGSLAGNPAGNPAVITRRREVSGESSVTVACGRLTARGEAALEPLARLLAGEIRRMAEGLLRRPTGPDCKVLAVGLGNAHMTPDAIGPHTIRRLTATRHLLDYDEALFASLGCCELSALVPGVMGQTGVESGELVKCAAGLVKPDLLVVVDALAARSCDRLASTIQLSDGGISPGAGVGNHRMAITRETMGCPVLAVGVPTVVDSSTLVLDALAKAGMGEDTLPDELLGVLEEGRSFVVSPRDCDQMVELTCRLLAMALNRVFGVAE